MHIDQLTVTEDLVRRLVTAQLPHIAHEPVRLMRTSGTVHAIARIADGLAARFPLRGGDPGPVRDRLVAEQRAAAEFATASTVPAPRPVGLGDPGEGYPLPWAVQTWVPGRTAYDEDPATSSAFAHDLAGLVTAVRAVPTRGRRFAGAGRGGLLRDHDAWVEHCCGRSEGLVDTGAVRALWASLRDLPRPPYDLMSHTDLVPGNVLVADGRLAGVLDTGDFGPADPALDLVGAWHLLDEGPRRTFREALACDDAEWARGAAWALQQAMGLVWYYPVSNPPMARTGLRTVARLLAAHS